MLERWLRDIKINSRRCLHFNGPEKKAYNRKSSKVMAYSVHCHDGTPHHDHDGEELGKGNSLHEECDRYFTSKIAKAEEELR